MGTSSGHVAMFALADMIAAAGSAVVRSCLRRSLILVPGLVWRRLAFLLVLAVLRLDLMMDWARSSYPAVYDTEY